MGEDGCRARQVAGEGRSQRSLLQLPSPRPAKPTTARWGLSHQGNAWHAGTRLECGGRGTNEPATGHLRLPTPVLYAPPHCSAWAAAHLSLKHLLPAFNSSVLKHLQNQSIPPEMSP